MKFDPQCRHRWIVTRWNTQEKYKVAELLVCSHCCKIQSWQDIVDGNHLYDAVSELCDMVTKYRKNQVDPDALREAFFLAISEGNLTIPEAKERIKAKYDLYAPVDPPEEEDKA